MKNIFKKGFTLIELLVVIAIIGILAAVVMASLNDARDSGSDASIKQTMGNIRSQAEIFYNQNNYTYTGVCASAEIVSLLNSVDGVNGAGSVACGSSATAWAASATLVSSSTYSWCVDSVPFTGQVTATTSATTCN